MSNFQKKHTITADGNIIECSYYQAQRADTSALFIHQHNLAITPASVKNDDYCVACLMGRSDIKQA